MTATSRLLAVGSADRIIKNPVVQFAMAVAVVTNTNAILVLNVSTDARVVKSERSSNTGYPRQEHPGRQVFIVSPIDGHLFELFAN